MVSTKLRTMQWLGINSTTCRGVNTDRCLNKGLWGNVRWNLNGVMWSTKGEKNYINVLKLLAIKLAKKTFSKTLKHEAILLQLPNMVALTYLLNMGVLKI